MTAYTDSKKSIDLFSITNDEDCNLINSNIQLSKYAEIYRIMNESVIQSKGVKHQLNWRWLDLNLVLHELHIHEFSSIDWYMDIDTDNQHANQRYNLNFVTKTFRDLSIKQRIDILQQSVIERLDSVLASNKVERAVENELGNVVVATGCYEEALQLDPHCLSALYNYAEMLSRSSNRKSSEKAIKLLTKFLLLNPKLPKAWGMLALMQENVGKIYEAVDCYEKAYLLDKTSAVRLRNHAMLMIEMKNYERANSLYEEVIDIDGQNGVIIGEYADLLHTMELMEESLAAFERAMATEKVNSTVINDYSVLLYKIAMEKGDEEMLRKSRSVLSSAMGASFVNTCAEQLKCGCCGGEAKHLCSGCKCIRYCSKNCQKQHWALHKKGCKRIKEGLSPRA